METHVIAALDTRGLVEVVTRLNDVGLRIERANSRSFVPNTRSARPGDRPRFNPSGLIGLRKASYGHSVTFPETYNLRTSYNGPHNRLAACSARR